MYPLICRGFCEGGIHDCESALVDPAIHALYFTVIHLIMILNGVICK